MFDNSKMINLKLTCNVGLHIDARISTHIWVHSHARARANTHITPECFNMCLICLICAVCYVCFGE